MSCLEIKVVFIMRQKLFLKSRLKSTLIFEVKFMSCLEIKVNFLRTRNAPEPAFYNYSVRKLCVACLHSIGYQK